MLCRTPLSCALLASFALFGLLPEIAAAGGRPARPVIQRSPARSIALPPQSAELAAQRDKAGVVAKPPLALSALRALPPLFAPGTALPDLMPASVAGNPHMIFPSDANDALPGTLPNFLLGGSPTSQVSFGYQNPEPGSTGTFRVERTLDGAPFSGGFVGGMASGEIRTAYRIGMPVVDGGRHTLGLNLDVDNTVIEFSETNNNVSSQWVWQPGLMPLETAIARAGVPDPVGGTATLDVGPAYANCAGLASPDFQPNGNDGFWGAVAICPASLTDDLDLGVFMPSTGPRTGFDEAYRRSLLLAGLTDFVLIDTDPASGLGGATGRRDVGTTLYAGSTAAQYTVHAVESKWWDHETQTTIPRTMGPGQLLNVFEVDIDPGSPQPNFRLDILNPNVDLDMALVPRVALSAGYYNLDDLLAYGIVSNAGGIGASETIAPASPLPAGFYALVVWKYSAYSAAQGVDYRLRASFPPLAVDGGAPPATSAFRGASPNPVREHTALAFDLARDAHVELAVHDVTGRRVASLANAAYAAGRHTVEWNGRGEDGRELPGGLYFARFEGGGVRETRKLTLVR